MGLDIDPGTSNLRGRVEIVVYPERLLRRLGPRQATEELKSDRTAADAVLQAADRGARGLRAQLRSGSLLTGQLFVAFDYFPDAPRAKVDLSQEKPVLPAVRSTIPELEAKLSSIVAKLDQLPLDEIGAQVTKALGTLNVTLKDASTTLSEIEYRRDARAEASAGGRSAA